jgi:hypothetical protein
MSTEIDNRRTAGGTQVPVIPIGLGLRSFDAHIDHLASLADLLALS